MAKLGQVVSVEIIDYPDSYRQAVGRVTEILGEIDDPGMEIEIAVRKYGVPHTFSPAALKSLRHYRMPLPKMILLDELICAMFL